MFKIRNGVTAGPCSKEVYTLPSMTVPDMGLSFRDLVNRHLHGSRVKTFETVYTGPNPSITDGIERMDAVDRQVLARELQDFVKSGRDKLMTAKQAREEEARKNAVIAEYERKRKALEPDTIADLEIDKDVKPGKAK